MEVQSIMHFLYTYRSIRHVMFDQHLLQEQESPLVIYSLADLHLGYPKMGSVSFLALITLLIDCGEFYDEGLLEQSAIHHFFLDSHLYFDSTRVRLSPDEIRIH